MVLSARHILRLEDGELKFDPIILRKLKFGYNQEELLRELKKTDCSAMADSSGRTLLHYAIQYKNVVIAEHMIGTGIDVNHTCTMGYSPLLVTLLLGRRQKEVIERLIKKICNAQVIDVLTANKLGTSPLALAADQRLFRNDLTVLPILHQLVISCEGDEELIALELRRVQCSLRRAVYIGNPKIIEIMINEKTSVNEQDPFFRETALHDAVWLMDESIVSVLVKSGADVSIKDISKRIPLAYYKSREDGQNTASFNPRVLRSLIGNFKDLTSLDSKGHFQISSILSRGTEKEVGMLLNNRVDFFAINGVGQTVLHLLSYHTTVFTNVAKFLLMKKEFPINICDNFGCTPLYLSVMNGNVGLVEVLLNRKADPMIKPNYSMPILFQSFPLRDLKSEVFEGLSEEEAQNRIKIIELLLEYGVDVQSRSQLGHTVFSLFSTKRMPDYAKPVIARFALDCPQKAITGDQSIMEIISANPHMKIFYDQCIQQIGQFKSSSILHIITKWDILVKTRIELNDIFMKHPKIVLKLQSLLREEGHSYYDSLIKEKIQKYVALLEF